MMKVVIVDDDGVFLIVTRKIIETFNKEVECVSFKDPKECLEYVLTHEVKVVVTDYQMPNMNGFELAEKLIQAKPDLHIYIQSGSKDVYKEEGFDSGFIEIHSKGNLEYLKNLAE